MKTSRRFSTKKIKPPKFERLFYGEGGIGKTRLLKELAKESKARNKNFAYVHYDFENIFDTRAILLTIKTQLNKQGLKFPLFETGNFYYNLKIGDADEMDAPKI